MFYYANIVSLMSSSVVKLKILFRRICFKIIDVPDSLSGRILPFLSDIRIRPDLYLKKNSGSGSGRILIKKKSPDPGPAGS